MAQLFPHLQGAFTPVPKTQEQIAREQRLQDSRVNLFNRIAPSSISGAFDTPDYLARQKQLASNAYLQAYSQMAGRDSAMQFTPLGAQQDRSAFSSPITQIFNPFLTTGDFSDIGGAPIQDRLTPTREPTPTGEPVTAGVPASQLPTTGGSVTSTRPLDATNAQNTAQRAEQTSNSLMDAWSSIQSISREGMPVLGSPDLKVKRDAYGRPYTVVSISPTDEQGRSQKRETLSFGISPETKESQGGTMAPSYQQTRQKPEQQALQNPEQIAELRRRQQLGMSGRGMAGSMASEPTATGTIVPPRPEGAKEMPAISPMSPMASKEAARTAQRWDAAEKAAIQGIKKKYGV
jgi:hypothetical protein